MAVVLLEAAIRHYMGTAAERAAFTSGLKAGDRFIETDTGFEWIWSGAAWVKLLVPAA